MGLCHTQMCVKLYECTKLGRNIVGEVCPNNVTWFCACMCRNEDTMNYVCCNLLCKTCSLLWPFSANISKSYYLLLSWKLSQYCAHSKNTASFNLPATLFSTPIVLFACTPFSTVTTYILFFLEILACGFWTRFTTQELVFSFLLWHADLKWLKMEVIWPGSDVNWMLWLVIWFKTRTLVGCGATNTTDMKKACMQPDAGVFDVHMHAQDKN